LDKKNKFKEGWWKVGERGVFGGSFSCVIFLGKWRRRMRSLNRWWKEGKWVGCLGYFERIEVSRIVLGAWKF
jgi:hypothetical protein